MTLRSSLWCLDDHSLVVNAGPEIASDNVWQHASQKHLETEKTESCQTALTLLSPGAWFSNLWRSKMLNHVDTCPVFPLSSYCIFNSLSSLLQVLRVGGLWIALVLNKSLCFHLLGKYMWGETLQKKDSVLLLVWWLSTVAEMDRFSGSLPFWSGIVQTWRKVGVSGLSLLWNCLLCDPKASDPFNAAMCDPSQTQSNLSLVMSESCSHSNRKKPQVLMV